MSTEIKFRPILFSGPMVKALLSGQKTQTRRTLKVTVEPQPTRFEHWGNSFKSIPEGAFVPTSNSGKIGIFEPQFVKCPYGKIGDVLWVREAWSTLSTWDEFSPSELTTRDQAHIFYAADGLKDGRGRASMHMPRWASRISLEITDIKVERLNDISEEDAKAEGVDMQGPIGYIPAMEKMGMARYQFANLWCSINSPDKPDAWDANPWVWAISFRRLTTGAPS